MASKHMNKGKFWAHPTAELWNLVAGSKLDQKNFIFTNFFYINSYANWPFLKIFYWYAINKVKTDVKKEPLATLTLPYHPSMKKLRPRLSQMGIRLTFSSSGTLGQQLWRRTPACSQPRGSVYVINCSACSDVYVGETGKTVHERMKEHEYGNTVVLGAVKKHNK